MNKTWTSWVWVGCFSVVWLLSEARLALGQGEPLKVEDVFQAWKNRQQRVRSLYFRWKQHITEGKGALHSGIPTPHVPSREPIPPHDVTYDGSAELWIEEEKIRYGYDGHEWSKEQQDMVPCPIVWAFDGKRLKTLMDNGGPDKPYPLGIVQPTDPVVIVGQVRVFPLLLTFRPLDSKMAFFRLSEAILTGGQARIDGRYCRELQLKQPGTGVVYQFWVDPSRDYTIVRYIETAKGKLIAQADIRFAEDPQAGWVPSNWDLVSQFPDGKLETSLQAEVLEHEINPGFPADRFDIVFPRGTSINDVEANRMYIIKQDGSERVLEKEEWGLTYQEVLASEPGELVGTQSFLARWWRRLLLAGAAVVVAVYGWFRYKRHLVRSSP
jgi:hypothetical protein